jgi:hypothetical protein
MSLALFNTIILLRQVHTFGFGPHHDSQLLSDIAEAGNGTYYYIEGEASIPEAFADALGGLLSVAVRCCSLTPQHVHFATS